MPWIRWVDEPDADDRLRALYRRCGGPDGIDHILKIRSLNPASLEREQVLLLNAPSRSGSPSLLDDEAKAQAIERSTPPPPPHSTPWRESFASSPDHSDSLCA